MKSVIEVYSDIAKSNPPWTDKEEKDFVASCVTKDGKWKDSASKERFVNEAMKHNLGLVFSAANKIAFDKNEEDMIQKAIIGMVEALKKYNPKKGYKISTWLVNPIKWTIMQHQAAYSKGRSISNEISSLNHKHNTNLSVVSLDMKIANNEDDETIGNMISEKNVCPGYDIAKSLKGGKEVLDEMDIATKIVEFVKSSERFLSKKETYVVNRLLVGKNQTEISKELHLSKVRISQLQKSAFLKIRNSPIGGHLKNLLK